MRAILLALGLAAWGAAVAVSAATAPKESRPAALPRTIERKVEPIGKIDGLPIPRPNGTSLGLQIVNNNFVLSFYNEKNRKVAPDVSRATIRWPVKYQPNDDRVVLNPGGDGTSLTSAKTIRPPHTFKVTISLFVEGSESAVETYVTEYGSSFDAP